jgi:hypothetical protein
MRLQLVHPIVLAAAAKCSRASIGFVADGTSDPPRRTPSSTEGRATARGRC